MFNHARTLLLNVSGSNNPGPTYLGEELVPSAYAELPLNSSLQTVRQHIFGADPDRGMLNYRAYQLLSLIEKTDLQSFVVDLDNRITYELGADHVFALNPTWEPKIQQISGTLDDVLTVVGTPARPDYTGKLYYQFEVDVLSTTTIQITRQTPPTKTENLPLSLSSDLSDGFDLYYTGYSAFVNTINPGASWRVSGYLRPQVDLTEIVSAMESAGDPVLTELFSTKSVEPWDTFRNLWYDSSDLVYRLGAIVLALIYSTDKARTNPNG
jgi:hypothetical protein